MMVVFAVMIGAVVLLFTRMPGSFLPNEDQGYLIASFQLPPGATLERTQRALIQAEEYILKQPEVKTMAGVVGFSFFGQGQNAALGFIPLKPWDERTGPGQDAQSLAGRMTGNLWASAMPSSSW
jgi:multidrug efflux pump